MEKLFIVQKYDITYDSEYGEYWLSGILPIKIFKSKKKARKWMYKYALENNLEYKRRDVLKIGNWSKYSHCYEKGSFGIALFELCDQ